MNLTLFIRGPPQARGQDPADKPMAENICQQSRDYRLQSERILTPRCLNSVHQTSDICGSLHCSQPVVSWRVEMRPIIPQ